MTEERPGATRLRWLLAQGLVVALGVFGALAADSWLNEREERRAEAELLTALIGDLAESRALLDRRVELYTIRRAAKIELLRVMRAGDSLTADSLDALFSRAIRSGTFDPPEGVIRSIIDGGLLQVISDPEIRTGIARWDGLRDDYTDFELKHNALLEDQLRPLLGSRYGLPTSVGEYELLPGSGPADLEGAARDREVESLLRLMAMYDDGLAIRVEESGTSPPFALDAQIDRLIGALEAAGY